MATRIWKGDAVGIAQESRATPANVEVNDVFTLTLNGSAVNYTSTGAAVSDVTAGLTTAWNNSTVLEHTEIAAATTGAFVKFLGNTAGLPYTITGAAVNNSTGGADDQTLTMSTTTLASGPNHWNAVDNWYTSTGGIADSGIPADDDNVIVENSAVSILFGLDQTAVTPSSVKFKASFTGNLGLPRTNVAGYVEYRDTYLKMTNSTDASTTLWDIGEGEGAGSGRLKIDGNTGLNKFTVFKSGIRAESGIPAILLKGTSTDNEYAINRGDVGIGFFGGESGSYTALRVGFLDAVGSDAKVVLGDDSPNVSGGTVTQTGGSLITSDVVETVTITGGEFHIRETATAATITVDTGTVFYETSGTLTNLSVGNSGVFDCRRDLRPRIVTNAVEYAGGSIIDPAETVTWSNGIDHVRCGVEDVNNQLGKNRTWTPSAI